MYPVRLAPIRPIRLGQTPSRAIQVKTVDDDGRPMPDVDILVSIENGQPESTWKYNVGLDGISVIQIPVTKPSDVLLVGPSLSMDMVSDPPFERIEVGQEIPEEVVFEIARRRPERDWIGPIITIGAAGMITGVVTALVSSYLIKGK